MRRHVVRGALVPIVTVTGLQLASLLGGVIVVEIVFAWPGLGQLALDAVRARDYPVVQGAVLLFATTFLVVNLLVDLLYAALDPRIRLPVSGARCARWRRQHRLRPWVRRWSRSLVAGRRGRRGVRRGARAVRPERPPTSPAGCSRRAASTGSAPTSSAATSSAGCSSPPGCRCGRRLISVGISLVAGVTIGLLAGYYGRFVDDALMRVMDMLFAFPAVLLAIAILAVRGPGRRRTR